MKKTITHLTLCLIGTLSFAQQAPAIQWQKAFGGTGNDYAYSIQPRSDGSYIVVGYTYSNDGDVTGNHGSTDAWVMKLTATGALVWQKTLGGTSYDYATSIQLTADGGYIVAGYTSSNDGDVTGNHGGIDAWIIKLTATGTLVWQNALGGNGDERAQSIQPTSDGGYIVAGITDSTNGDVTGIHGDVDAWVVKLNATGALEWQKALGGTNYDYASSIQATPNGGYILAGFTYSTDGDVTGNHGSVDAWVVKLAANGDLEWQKTLGGTAVDRATSIQLATNGGYILAGFTNSINGDIIGNHGNGDAWVVQLEATGALVWQKALGGTSGDEAYNIQPTSDGGYILAGFTNSNDGDVTGNLGSNDAWVVKLTATGTIVWKKVLGGTSIDEAQSIQLTSDGGYIVAGYTQSNNGNVTGYLGSDNVLVVKLGPELATSFFNNQELTLYPNPTKGLLQLQTPNNTSFNKIIITDSTGKIVLEQTQNTTQVNVEQLASGLNIIKAFSGEEVFVNKFVRE